MHYWPLFYIPVEFLDFLGIVKILLPLFRHGHQVCPLLLQALLILDDIKINQQSLCLAT